MYIKRNVYFSATDETGEERLYCVNEILSEDEYQERLYSEEEERTFASVRKAKKLGKQLVNEMMETEGVPSRKFVGQIMARSNRAGLGKNEIKNINGKGYNKVMNGSLSPIKKELKKTGFDNKEIREMIGERMKEARDMSLDMAKAKVARGGKGISLNTIYG